ncbi:MAG: OmpA family protein [Bacteroidales bacterium]|nr:OmpA family protein [Bacteroidales bacterium]
MKSLRKTRNLIILSVAGMILAAGCVPQRKYQDVVNTRDKYKEQNKKLIAENEEMSSALKEYKSDLETYKKRIKSLQQDTAVLSTTKKRLTDNYNELYASYEQLKKNREQQISQSKEEAAKILADLQKTQTDILAQRDSLKKLEQRLKEKQVNLKEMSQELSVAQSSMKEKEKRLNELQSILDRKDSVVTALKDKVNDALRGFEGEGLSIEQKNGKVYVSMEEKLLFASGSYSISSQGKQALKELGKVLKKNKDINVMIEGHTDSVPYNGTGQLKDNWDLSVKRSTTIIRVLTQYSDIDGERLIAAGRSEYVPVASNKTKAGRAKNRRTEIILTPKLDELFKIIETH